MRKPATIVATSYGVVLFLTSSAPERWRGAFPPRTRFSTRSRAPASLHIVIERVTARLRLVVDGVLVTDSDDVRHVRDHLEGIVALHVAAHAPSHVFIHAGVVVWRGRALIVPGRTLAGKSTLVDALVGRGATYYSDEYAIIDARGRIRPYPRRMSLRRAGRLPLRRVMPQPADRGIAPGWVVGVRYESGAKIDLVALSPGKVAMLLLSNAVAARISPRRVLVAVRRVAEVSRGWSGTRDEARPFARSLIERCDGL